MMKNYACIIITALIAFSSCERTVKIMDIISEDSISAIKNTDIEIQGDEICMISTGSNEMGISIKKI